MAETIYLLLGYGLWVLPIVGPLVIATVVTLVRVVEPRPLLTIAIFTSLTGTVTIAETIFRSYDVLIGRFWLVVECTGLELVAVVLGIIALRRLGIRVFVTLAVLFGTVAVVATVIVTSGIHRVIAANMINGAGAWIGSSPFVGSYVNQARVDVVTILTPAVATVVFWPTWFLTIGRLRASRPFLRGVRVALVGVAVIAVVTWALLPQLTNQSPVPQILLHEALVVVFWWIAIGAGRQKPQTSRARLSGSGSPEPPAFRAPSLR